MSPRSTRIAVAAVVAGLTGWAAPNALALDVSPPPQVAGALAPVTAAVPAEAPAVPVAPPAAPTPPVAAPVGEVERVVETAAQAAPVVLAPTHRATAPVAASRAVSRVAEPRSRAPRRLASAGSDTAKKAVASPSRVAPAAPSTADTEATAPSSRSFPIAVASASPDDENAPIVPRLPDLPVNLSSAQLGSTSALLVFAALAVFFLGAAAPGLVVPLRLAPRLALPTGLFSRLERPG